MYSKLTSLIEDEDDTHLISMYSQSGDLSGGCASAGPHYNPFGKTHGAPSAPNRHVGDLGNIQADELGEANFVLTDGLLSLNGPTSIIG